MITSNALYDIYYTFLLIRYDIQFDLNPAILDKIIEVVKAEKCEDNSIRIALSSIDGLDSVKWKFVYHNNLYVYTEIIKNREYIFTIANICVLLKKLIEARSFDQAYDFVDSIHFLPILMKDKTINKNRFWKQTKQYRGKWGNFNFSFKAFIV